MDRQTVRVRPAAGMIAVFWAALLGVVSAEAGPPYTIRYPRVYGATGHPYGPTQAHYQYQRQYGRPWHGYGGQTLTVHGSPAGHFGYAGPVVLPGLGFYGPVLPAYGVSPYGVFGYAGYGVGTGLPGYADYGPVYSSIPMAPFVMQGYPLWVGRSPFSNEVLRQAQQENRQRWQQPLKLTPAPSTPLRRMTPSTPAAKTKSQLAQARGDAYLRRQEYHKAYQRYRTALQTAPDRPEPFFRLGFTLAAIGYYDKAADYFKRGLQLDPQWPVAGESLGRIFGRNNGIAITGILGNATRWAKEDIRDPDRLFLLGVLLHFDNQVEKAHILFEAAYRLAGGGEHLRAFLTSPVYANRTLPGGKTPTRKSVSGKVAPAAPAGGSSPAVPNNRSSIPVEKISRPRVQLQPPIPPLGQQQRSDKLLVPPLPVP